ncbi:hypothetical protein AGMMS4957_05900 [Bacteroidia bacterium]|nr:hypothetical protein AGMMS4957_05900 [Bacteroidia bacterium]
MLFRAAKIDKLTKEDMETYKKSVLEYADVRRCADFAHEQGFEKGVQQGIQQGVQQGIQQGVEQGIQEGLQQGFYEIAQKCVQEGMSFDLIVRLTGLSAEEINHLPRD